MNSSLIVHFSVLPDPRRDINKKHLLIDIVVIALAAAISGAEGWNEVEEFGRLREKWLRSFLALPYGVPSHDTFRDVFMRLDPREFGKCFLAFVDDLSAEQKEKTIAIDGKSLRRSFDKAAGKSVLHLVNAWSSELGISLGQVAVAEKSNEITAVPKILDVLDLKSATVTLDAMGCQTEVAAKVCDRGGDYVLAVKENQKGLFDEIDDFFRLSEAEHFADVTYESFECVEKDHGRIETRKYYLAHDLDVISNRMAWKNLRGLGMVISTRQVNGTNSYARRYFITSHGEGKIKRFAKSVRAHWAVENNLHWCLDVVFHEDACRKRKDNSAENFASIRKLALTLLKKETSRKLSVRGKRHLATMSQDYLDTVLFG